MHRSHVQKVPEKLNERALYVKKSKSRFETKEIKFLGLYYSTWANREGPEKTDAVRNWPPPNESRKYKPS
jgi:hypothetical protein